MRKRHEDTPGNDGFAEEGHYRIRVRGHLGTRWSGAFGGLRITPEADGATVIEGFIRDQAALHAVLRQVRDLGLELLSVGRGPPREP